MRWFLLFLLLTFLPPKGSTKLVEKTVASVGEEIVLLTDLKLFKRQLLAGLIPNSLLFKIFPKKNLIKKKSHQLEFIILQKILYQMAREKNLSVSPKSFPLKGKLKLTRDKTKNLTPSEKSFIKNLRRYRLTLKKFWKVVDSYATNDLLLAQEVASKVTISDNEVNAYHFNKYGRNLFTDFEYEFSSLSFPINKKGKDKMKDFLKSLSTKPFHEVAKQNQLKVKTSKLKNSEINPIMYKSLRALSVSQVSKPVFLNNRFYLLKLKWKTPVLNASKQKRQVKIQTYLFETELKKELKKWLEKQRASFPIKVYFP